MLFLARFYILYHYCISTFGNSANLKLRLTDNPEFLTYRTTAHSIRSSKSCSKRTQGKSI